MKNKDVQFEIHGKWYIARFIKHKIARNGKKSIMIWTNEFIWLFSIPSTKKFGLQLFEHITEETNECTSTACTYRTSIKNNPKQMFGIFVEL